MIVDGIWTSVGSCNLDDRSLRLNDEANLNIYDRGFARQHTDVFARDRANSREITLEDWRRRSPIEKIRGGFGSLFRSQL